MPADRIELWFDFSCPYAYLASRRAAGLAEQAGVPLVWRPMLLGGVFRAIAPDARTADGPMATLAPAKATSNVRDMHRWAEAFGAPLTIPAAHPMRTVRALRVLLGLPEAVWPRAIEAIYASYWQRGEDVTQDAVLAAALRDVPGAADAIAGADRDAIKDELRRRTDEAVALGVFGAPAWVVRRGSETRLFWGQDRMEWVLAEARGEPLPPPSLGPPPPSPRDARPIEMFFDVSSPYAYLALTQLPRLAAHTGAAIEPTPIFLGGLFRDLRTPDVPLFSVSEAKRRYVLRELGDFARAYGEPFGMPRKFPQRTLVAQRMLAVTPATDRLPLARALGHAIWAAGRDLEDEATLADLGGADLVARAKTPEAKAALLASTARAQALGAFGVPTYVVDDRLVWGQDRQAFVAAMSAGWAPACG